MLDVISHHSSAQERSLHLAMDAPSNLKIDRFLPDKSISCLVVCVVNYARQIIIIACACTVLLLRFAARSLLEHLRTRSHQPGVSGSCVCFYYSKALCCI